jgi:hypothetical protein
VVAIVGISVEFTDVEGAGVEIVTAGTVVETTGGVGVGIEVEGIVGTAVVSGGSDGVFGPGYGAHSSTRVKSREVQAEKLQQAYAGDMQEVNSWVQVGREGKFVLPTRLSLW